MRDPFNGGTKSDQGPKRASFVDKPSHVFVVSMCGAVLKQRCVVSKASCQVATEQTFPSEHRQSLQADSFSWNLGTGRC